LNQQRKSKGELMNQKVKKPLVAFFLITAFSLFTDGASAWPIPDTGQTKCYNNTAEIPCPAPGQPFYGQDGNYSINPRSYAKLDASGAVLPDMAATWAMVKDNVTESFSFHYAPAASLLSGLPLPCAPSAAANPGYWVI